MIQIRNEASLHENCSGIGWAINLTRGPIVRLDLSESLEFRQRSSFWTSISPIDTAAEFAKA
jgi:hypothetical protein